VKSPSQSSTPTSNTGKILRICGHGLSGYGFDGRLPLQDKRDPRLKGKGDGKSGPRKASSRFSLGVGLLEEFNRIISTGILREEINCIETAPIIILNSYCL
jgi:hypothetical protein